MSIRTGSLNNNWKGGRSISSHGYVLIRVGKLHPSADVRGYAYEHKLVMEKKLGRRLKKGEIIHHEDGNKKNNKAENLILTSSNKEHFFLHRKNNSLRMPGEKNVVVSCECGCGVRFKKYDYDGRPRRFVPAHNLHRRKNG